MFFLVFLFLFFPLLLLSFSFLSPFSKVFTVTKGWKKRPPPPLFCVVACSGSQNRSQWGGGWRSSREGLDLAPFLLSCSPSFLSCFPSFFSSLSSPSRGGL
jgi:hypothetical protein